MLDAMIRSDLLALARAGVQARLNDIDDERRRLLRSFHGLTK